MQTETAARETSIPERERAGPAAGWSRLSRRGLGTVGGALAALAVWALADPVLGVELAAMQVGPGAVAASSLVSALGGWGLLVVLERTVARPRTVWTRTAAAVAVLSLAGPLGAATTATAVVLGVMHVVVAAVVIPTFAATSSDR